MLLLMANVRVRLILAALVVVFLVALTTFLAAAQHSGTAPTGDYVARKTATWGLDGPDATSRRHTMLMRAAYRASDEELARFAPPVPPTLPSDTLSCRFLNDPPSGTTAKFNCVLDGGTVIKVKYGRNPEIQGEVLGTRLLRALGFPADDVSIVRRLRCYGCPRDPFVTVVAATWTFTRELLGPAGFDDGYTDFEWVAVERKFPAPAIELDDVEGWAWWEVQRAKEHRADLDALRLLAMFMAHWDNKTENQRLVCLDGPTPDPQADCSRPLAMIQDLGATFGPTKVNIGRWPSVPIWSDRATCTVSMRSLPWGGGTFPDARISEAGRRQIADGLARFGTAEIRDLFQTARVPEFQTATDDELDLQAWVAAFQDKVRQIADAGPCPDA